MKKIYIYIILFMVFGIYQLPAQTFNFVLKAGNITKVYPISDMKKLYFSELRYDKVEKMLVYYNDGRIEEHDLKEIENITLKEDIEIDKYEMIVHLENRNATHNLKLLKKIKFTSKTKTGVENSVEIFPVMIYPNPFINNTKIIISLIQSENLNIKIIDERGYTLREFAQYFSSGQNEIVWDGRDSNGNPVYSGVYYAIISNRTEVQFTKVIKLD